MVIDCLYYVQNMSMFQICDADKKILHVDASFGGASYDSHVWNMFPVSPAVRRLHDEERIFWFLGK